LWEDFHTGLIGDIANQLADVAPQHYVIRKGERSYLVLVESNGKDSHPFLPDVNVMTRRGRKKAGKKSGTALVQPATGEKPHVLRAFIEEEHLERFVEIYETKPDMRLVTSIEVLSPANKRPNAAGWNVYQRKRQSILLDYVNFVEIDLLRGGQRLPMLDPWPDSPYTLMVARARRPHACQVWEAHFRRPLPTIPVPLAKPDPDITLSLQPLIDSIYQRFRYGSSIDYAKELTPPLSAEDTAWCRQLLRTAAGE
jgi:hypothetical protein